MAESRFQFRWRVSQAGYKVIEGSFVNSPDTSEPLLIGLAPVGTEDQVKLYLPLEQYSALFKTFAELDCTNESVAGFADRYGFLGESNTWVNAPDYENVVWGESLVIWFEQIDKMGRPG